MVRCRCSTSGRRPARRRRRRPSPAPGRRRCVSALPEQRAACLGLLVDQRPPARRRAPRSARRPGRPGPAPTTSTSVCDVHGVVAGGVGDLGQPALPADAARDQPVVQLDGGGRAASARGRAPRSGPGRRCPRPTPAAMPRGRPSLMLVATWCTPLASSAEARVSPGCPVRLPAVEGERAGACRGRCGRRGQSAAAERLCRGHEIAGFCSSDAVDARGIGRSRCRGRR